MLLGRHCVSPETHLQKGRGPPYSNLTPTNELRRTTGITNVWGPDRCQGMNRRVGQYIVSARPVSHMVWRRTGNVSKCLDHFLLVCLGIAVSCWYGSCRIYHAGLSAMDAPLLFQICFEVEYGALLLRDQAAPHAKTASTPSPTL